MSFLAKFFLNTRKLTQRKKYLEAVGLPQDGAVPKLKTRCRTFNFNLGYVRRKQRRTEQPPWDMLEESREAQNRSNFDQEITRSLEKDACAYSHDNRGKKRILDTYGAIESPAKRGKHLNLHWVTGTSWPADRTWTHTLLSQLLGLR